MASFAATGVVASIRMRDSNYFVDPSTVSAGNSIWFRERKQVKLRSLDLTAKAMGEIGGGGAKYKGTQMRERKLTEMIEKKVIEAREVCEGDKSSDECKVAWDEVEEVSQAKADLRLKLEREEDPLESFCHDNPETDECRIYED